jgi:flavodoxin
MQIYNGGDEKMADGKALVVFYSMTGNTKKIARYIAGILGSDIEPIRLSDSKLETESHLKVSLSAIRHESPSIRNASHNPALYEVIIICTPIWSRNISSPVRAYISTYSGSFKKVAFLCTMNSSGDKKVFKDMEELCGRKPCAVLGLTAEEVAHDIYEEKAHKFINNVRSGILWEDWSGWKRPDKTS